MAPLKNPFAVTNADADVESQSSPPAWNNPNASAWGGEKPVSATQSAYGGSTGLSVDESTLRAREAELNRREADIIKREEELRKLGVVKKKRNWPPCCPVTYHDIGAEIPADLRGMVRQLYLCYLGLVLCLLWNLAASSTILGTNQKHKVSSWFLAVIYVVTGVPLAFFFWYRRIYNAARSDAALGYVAFFVSFAIHIAFCIYAAVGFQFNQESWSFAGFISAIKAFDINSLYGILFIVGACLWSAEALWSLWCCKQVYSSFRGRGGAQRTQQEVQSVAINAFLQHQGPTRA